MPPFQSVLIFPLVLLAAPAAATHLRAHGPKATELVTNPLASGANPGPAKTTPRLVGKLGENFHENYSQHIKRHADADFDRSHLRLGMTLEGIFMVAERVGFMTGFDPRAKHEDIATWGLRHFEKADQRINN